VTDLVTTFTVKGLLSYAIQIPAGEKEIRSLARDTALRFRRSSEPGEKHACQYITDSRKIVSYVRKLKKEGKLSVTVEESTVSAVLTNPYDDFTAPNTPEGQEKMNDHIEQIIDDDGNLIVANAVFTNPKDPRKLAAEKAAQEQKTA